MFRQTPVMRREERMLTEADYFVVPGATMDDITCKWVVGDGPYQFQGSTENLANSSGFSYRNSRQVKGCTSIHIRIG